MKKTIFKILLLCLMLIGMSCANTYAAQMENLQINLDKTTVHPGENVTVHVDFGQFVGSYTFDFAYDSNLLEFVSASDGAASDNSTRVRVVFPNGGTSPAEELNVVFKAKTGITTSNPTEINITAEGLANANASEIYDDITTPITKQLMVEPVYEDYAIDLKYTGNILANTAKDMTLSITSSMGKSYEHVRLIAQATTPEGATVKLIGKDENGLDQDIIASGWGKDEGYSIGGKDVKQVLNLAGTFTKSGAYSINFKLVNREDSDSVIAQKTIALNVGEPATTQIPEETKKEETPKVLPKTGSNIYIAGFSFIAILVIIYAYVSKKR